VYTLGWSAWFNHTAFGKQTVASATGVVGAKSAVGFDRGFTGHVADAESGLLHARARQYSPQLGRFASRDPWIYVDGWMLYRGYFVPNGTDLSGKKATWGPVSGPGDGEGLDSEDEIKKKMVEAGITPDERNRGVSVVILNFEEKPFQKGYAWSGKEKCCTCWAKNAEISLAIEVYYNKNDSYPQAIKAHELGHADEWKKTYDDAALRKVPDDWFDSHDGTTDGEKWTLEATGDADCGEKCQTKVDTEVQAVLDAYSTAFFAAGYAANNAYHEKYPPPYGNPGGVGPEPGGGQ
jgi:RHS repeat-associated protein